MALDPNIALGVRGVEVANPLAQYAQVAQIQSMQNQNQVSQMQLDQMRRDEATLQQIQAKAVEHGGPADLNQIADAYLKSGNPKFVEFGIGLRQKLDDRENIAKVMNMGRPPAATPAAPATNALAPTMQAGALGSGTFGMAPEPRVNQFAPAVAPAPAANALAAPGGLDLNVLLAQRKAFIAMGKPDMARALDAEIALASKEPVYHNVVGVGLVDPRNARVVMPSVEKPPAPPTSAAEYELAQKDPNFMRFLQARAAATRQPVQPSPPVAIVGEDGRVKYVTREEALGKTPATAIEGLSPKDIQKREAVLPQARQSVKTVGNTMSVIGETVDRILANPEGLDGITGVIYGRTPALTDAARKANADLEQLKNLAFVQGLTELRAASKTGAGVGNVSNREGDRFENLKASLDRTQSKTDLEDALRRLKEQANFTTQTMQEAFDETYKYKQTAPSTQTPAATQGTNGFKYLGKESTK
jgi:hypothetical protein